MIILVYILIIVILFFVCFIGIKAAGEGIEAKKRNKNYKKNTNKNKKNVSKNLQILKNLYKEGDLTKKEFQKAKSKILNN